MPFLHKEGNSKADEGLARDWFCLVFFYDALSGIIYPEVLLEKGN